MIGPWAFLMFSCVAPPMLASTANSDTVVVHWVAVYDGPESREDRCTGMVLAPDGSAYLAGYSFGAATDFDFAVLKVDTTGRIVWVNRYGSPIGCEDRPWCLCRDSSGDIVAAGGSIADMAVLWDFRIIKYRPTGETVWTRLLDFPTHAEDKIAGAGILSDNSIVVAGSSRYRPDHSFGPAAGSQSRADWDVTIARYSSQGETLWTRRFDGKAHGDDLTAGLALDRTGNCYVAGQTTTAGGTEVLLLKYNPSGQLLWRRTLCGNVPGSSIGQGVIVDSASRAWVFGACYNQGRSFDFLVACFDSSGRQLAYLALDAAARVDICQAACLDRAGNLYATGQSTGRGTSFDVLTVKVSPAGETLWTRRFHGTGADRGWCIGLDQFDRVVVGATSDGPAGQPNMMLLCYGPDGELAWTFSYAGGGAGEARPVAIERGGENELLVAGSACRPGTDFDIVLLRLAPGGGR